MPCESNLLHTEVNGPVLQPFNRFGASAMKVGDLVKVSQAGPRQGEIGLVQHIDERWGTYDGTVNYYHVVFPNKTLKLREDTLEVISASR